MVPPDLDVLGAGVAVGREHGAGVEPARAAGELAGAEQAAARRPVREAEGSLGRDRVAAEGGRGRHEGERRETEDSEHKDSTGASDQRIRAAIAAGSSGLVESTSIGGAPSASARWRPGYEHEQRQVPFGHLAVISTSRDHAKVELLESEYRVLIMETLMRIDAKADRIIDLLDGDEEEEDEADS